jgi:hypothetical protein
MLLYCSFQELSQKIRPTWDTKLNKPEITRADLNNLGDIIREASAEAGGLQADCIRKILSEQAKPQSEGPKLKKKKMDSVSAHKISFENMHMYFYQEQCDFQRKEHVEFPQKSKTSKPKPIK